MSDKRFFELHAEVCKALANPLRIQVVDILGRQELCFSDILEITGGLKSNLSRNLSVMVKAGILKMRKDKTCNYYSLSSRKVAQACLLMREVLMENMKKRNDLLKKYA